jgi:hypothetical protein
MCQFSIFTKKCLLFACLIVSAKASFEQNNLIYNAGKYQLYNDKIVQGQYTAKATSERQIVSNYKSPVNLFKSAAITFKFSINGKDNEMKSGVDHHFFCIDQNGIAETPLIKFGRQLNDQRSGTAYLKPNTLLKIRLDMRDVLEQFKTKGFYTIFNGDKLYQKDFKGVYIAGNSAPLIWDFDNLVHHSDLELHDSDKDGIYEVSLQMNNPQSEEETASEWKQTKDVSAFASYSSGYTISDALYRLAIEEMINAVEPDSTFRTGKEWAGVWTRDISYSIILAMAHLQPQVAKYSLLKKVNRNKKIIQDTGTGGAWPASTDRIIWAVAAWELYKVTGDKDWLQQAYEVVRNSIHDDLNTIYDRETGLVKGESSFLDWREQTYPRWMQPADIAESECLGTNVVHYAANMMLSKMAAALNHTSESIKYNGVAESIRTAINKYLWQPDKKYYAQYLYGRNSLMVSPRAEALGEALAVIFNVATKDVQKEIIANTPLTDFGITCIYPQIPGIPPYHNNAVWPFVQSFWLWAGAKAANEKSVMESIAAIYRPAALFATDKENFVAADGDFLGTQINSSNMLWSLSGSISIIHKVLFGIRFEENNLRFEPFVPAALKGQRSLDNFKYRNMVLSITMTGYGNKIKQFILDGKVLPSATISSDLKGQHVIKIVLLNNRLADQRINKVVNYTSLPTPEVELKKGNLTWQPLYKSKYYKIFGNGQLITTTQKTVYPILRRKSIEYQVVAVDEKGIESFASEPLMIVGSQYVASYEVEDFGVKPDRQLQGYSGTGYVDLTLRQNTNLSIPIKVSSSGEYAIDFRYANGNGPINTENKCAIRTLEVDGKPVGTSLFPQRGKEEWSNWGFSNAVQVKLSAGNHLVTLHYRPSNENMNGDVNDAVLDYMRIIERMPVKRESTSVNK